MTQRHLEFWFYSTVANITKPSSTAIPPTEPRLYYLRELRLEYVKKRKGRALISSR
jgi:hypothetical protein